MVRDLRGMFAFAIWDDTRARLFLARDPYGIKPLYYADDGWTFRFACQVKALLAGGSVSRDPEPAGVVGFYLFGSVPEPFTLYRAIRGAAGGRTRALDRAGARAPRRYHSIAAVLRRQASAIADSRRSGTRRLRSAALRQRARSISSPTCRSAPSCRRASIPARSSA